VGPVPVVISCRRKRGKTGARPALSRSCEGLASEAQPERPPVLLLLAARTESMTFKKIGLTGAIGLAVMLLLLDRHPAQAHHLIEILALPVTPLNGLISGLAHPVIGPDHLVFLLALSLVGLRAQARWMLGLLLLGLLGAVAGVLLPGLPGTELLLALSLAIEALVVLGRLPSAVLLPTMVLHGYGLSIPALGWNSMPLATYLLGLLISQGLLLALALVVLQKAAATLRPRGRYLLAGLLMAISTAGTLVAVLA
jgi:urease accessory protein